MIMYVTSNCSDSRFSLTDKDFTVFIDRKKNHLCIVNDECDFVFEIPLTDFDSITVHNDLFFCDESELKHV